jgi:hypothetical protein
MTQEMVEIGAAEIAAHGQDDSCFVTAWAGVLGDGVVGGLRGERGLASHKAQPVSKTAQVNLRRAYHIGDVSHSDRSR